MTPHQVTAIYGNTIETRRVRVPFTRTCPACGRDVEAASVITYRTINGHLESGTQRQTCDLPCDCPTEPPC